MLRVQQGAAPLTALKATMADLKAHFGRIDPTWGEVNRIRRGTVDLPVDVAPEVSLWVHSVGPDGDSTRTPVDVRVHGGSTDTAFRVADAAMSAFAVGTGTDPARLTISLAPGTASS